MNTRQMPSCLYQATHIIEGEPHPLSQGPHAAVLHLACPMVQLGAGDLVAKLCPTNNMLQS